MKILQLTLATILFLNFASCKKAKKDPETPAPTTSTSSTETKKAILNDLASNVIYASYSDLANKATIFYNNVVAFSTATTAVNLSACRQAWKDVRNTYEQTEGFLFGPMSVNNIDPDIDTWPVDFARLDSVLASSAVFSASYITSLEESLKGFHPVEYLLYGKDGSKNETQFKSREMDFMIALSLNIKTLCSEAQTSWDVTVNDNYNVKFTTAGSGSTVYPTFRSAYEELINAMADICDEVANGKMKDPFEQFNPALEESPFSKNSLIDFTNNIKSVQNIYLGKYVVDGKGLEDLIKANNLAMDGAIKTKIANTLTALGNITVPFGQAISATNGQRTLVQTAMTTADDLRAYLSGDVKTYLQTITN